MKKTRKQKLKSKNRRQKQLDRFVKTLYKERDGLIELEPNKEGSEKKEVVRVKQSITGEAAYIKTDLRNLLILTGVLIVVVVVIYFFEMKNGFLEPLADSLLKDVIK